MTSFVKRVKISSEVVKVLKMMVYLCTAMNQMNKMNKNIYIGKYDFLFIVFMYAHYTRIFERIFGIELRRNDMK